MPAKLKLEPYRVERRQPEPSVLAHSVQARAFVFSAGIFILLGVFLCLFKLQVFNERLPVVLVVHTVEETYTSPSPVPVSPPPNPEPVAPAMNWDLSSAVEKVNIASVEVDELVWKPYETAELDVGTLWVDKQTVTSINSKPSKSQTGDAEETQAASIVETSPQVLQAPLPPYPESARRAGQTGVVKLMISVDELGGVSEVALEVSSGYVTLDRAAMNWVKDRWKFRPANRQGIPIASRVLIPVRFSLK